MRRTPSLTAALALVALSLALGACGRKGPLDYPLGAETEKVVTPEGRTVERLKKPERPFVLDPLLN